MVPHAAPGDLLEVTVVQERGGYLIARAERVLKAGGRAPHAAVPVPAALRRMRLAANRLPRAGAVQSRGHRGDAQSCAGLE